jgi:LysR family transcriptional activator of nhaA
LIPGQETVVRSRLLRWFAEQQMQPRIVGEFDDSA